MGWTARIRTWAGLLGDAVVLALRRVELARQRLRLAASTCVVVGLTIALSSIPLFSRPSYESALLFGLLLPPITAISVALERRVSSSVEAIFVSATRRGFTHATVLVAVLSAQALRGGWCSPGHDLTLLALGPVIGIVVAAWWGAVVRIVIEHFRRVRFESLARIGLALLGPLATIAWSVLAFYRSPSVFAFDPFVGFFAGSPYDTGFDPTSRLLSYRAGTVGLGLAAWALARHLERDGAARLRLSSWRERLDGPLLVVGVAGLGLFVAITALGEPLGHRSSTAWIRQQLGRAESFGRCEIVFGAAPSQTQVKRLGNDCNGWLGQLERRLEVAPLDRVSVFVFDSSAQKELLMGAAHTQIAKPWRKEIYLNGASYPDDVVGHELAHVVAGLTARGPFRIGGDLGGWLPNPGLIEGMAVAMAPDEDGDLTALEWSAALERIGRLPPIRELFSLGFLGHSGPLAYTVAGAFVEWLAEQRGPSVLRRWYAGESLEQVTGMSFPDLHARFAAALKTVPLPVAALPAARAKFARQGVYTRRCPHAVDRALAEADQRLGAGDPLRACTLYREARQLDPTEIRARFGAGDCALAQTGLPDRRPIAERAYQSIADDIRLPEPVRQHAQEKIADLRLVAGDIEQARSAYASLLADCFDADRRRTLELKYAAQNDTEIRALKVLLLGTERETGFDLAVRELLRWSSEAPEDGLADYLLGRNFWLRGRERAGIEHLERALARRITFADIRAEALRLRAVTACAVGDPARATEIADQLAHSTDLPTPRRLGLLRLVERCGGRPLQGDWHATRQAVIAPASVPAAKTAMAEPPYDSDQFDCPKEMVRIQGGEIWLGSGKREPGSDEAPRFLTKVRSFCVGRTEVTVEAYARCVEQGDCRPALGKSASCNARHRNRERHPINCVDFRQAAEYCKSQNARLPTEVEWEYAARGGSRSLTYPWGDGSPDGRACWKQPSSCQVASYPAGAFGLFDMTGNVWEWTASDYGPYPWGTTVLGMTPLKVYRGGGWSRRFEKWMRTGLRNRALPTDSGAHLGFRCVSDPAGLGCPFERSPTGACLFGVLGAECPTPETWNGQRCARPGEGLCPVGHHAEPGLGCQRDLPVVITHHAPDVDAVNRQRSAEFDRDCQTNQPKRPHAYRYLASSHEARNLAVSRAGCKNRDVGVGWNSACCP